MSIPHPPGSASRPRHRRNPPPLPYAAHTDRVTAPPSKCRKGTAAHRWPSTPLVDGFCWTTTVDQPAEVPEMEARR
jgi:hypothetical protein